LREEEGSVGVDAAALASGGTAAIEAPVPRGEDEDVDDPESSSGLQQGDGRLCVFRQGGDKQAEGPDHVQGDDGTGNDAEPAVEGVQAAAVGEDRGDGENGEDAEEEPVGSPGESFGEGEAEGANSKESEHGGPAGLWAFGWFCGCAGHGLEVAEVVDDFGRGPVLGADEFAADDAVRVDDVGFGRARGVEGVVGFLGEVEDGGDAGDVVIDDILLVGVGVGIEADGKDDNVGHAALEFDEGGKLLKAGRAPAGPEIEDDDFALMLIVAKADGLRAVVDDDGGGVFADLGGVGGAVAALEQATGNREEATGKQKRADSGQRIADRNAAFRKLLTIGTRSRHVSIIRCRSHGRVAADSLRCYSRAQ
jgi:hypothetical protein